MFFQLQAVSKLGKESAFALAVDGGQGVRIVKEDGLQMKAVEIGSEEEQAVVMQVVEAFTDGPSQTGTPAVLVCSFANRLISYIRDRFRCL